MRKIFSLFAAMLFAGSLMAAEVTVTYNGKYSNQESLDGVPVTEGVVTITFAKGTGSTAPAYYNTGTGARTYGGNTITVDAGTNSITKIAFDFSQNSKDYTVDEGAYSKTNKEWTGSASTVVFTTESGAGHNRIKSITVTYEAGGSGEGPVVVKTLKSIAVSGMTTEFKQNAAFAFDGECTATYSVTEDDVPVADQNAKVTPTSVSEPDMSTVGTKEVTVSYTEGEITKEAKYEITVVEAPSTGTFVLFDGEIEEGDYLITYENGAMNTTVAGDRLQYDAISPVDNKVSDPDASLIWHIAKSGEYWTLYNEAAGKYAASTGVKNKAQMLADGTDDKALWTVSGDGTYEFVNKANAAASINSNLRKNGTYGFACYATTTGGALTLYKMENSAAGLAKPVITGEATFEESVQVTITAADGAQIRYTLNGEDPTAESALYESALTLTETTTVKAVAIKGEEISAVASKTFTKVEPLVVTNCATGREAALSVSANNEIYAEGEKTEFTIRGYVTKIQEAWSDQHKNLSFWMADTKDGGEVLEAFRAVCETEDAAPKVGDVVEVTGNLTKYGTTPEFAKGCTFVILNDISTAVVNTEAGVKAVKVMENGQIFIIKNGVKYNAQGAVVR